MEKIRIICFEEWLRCDCFHAFREANVKVVEEIQIQYFSLIGVILIFMRI